MKTTEMVPVYEFCIHHNIDISFIYSLNKSGLVEIIRLEETTYLPLNQLKNLELLVLLYQDMDINIEGIETISHLLQQITDMQQKILLLTNRLRLYE